MNEQDLLKRVIDLAKLTGWSVAHFRPAMTKQGAWVTRMDGHSGFPDLCMTRRGRLVFAELKAGRNKLSEAQEQWLERLRLVPGVEVYVWRDSDWEATINCLTND